VSVVRCRQENCLLDRRFIVTVENVDLEAFLPQY
jgi:hypothetical protein